MESAKDEKVPPVGGLAEKSEVAKMEEVTLAFWRQNNIFEKSLEQTRGKGEFTFYDGPPFATGLPHYGHILAGTIKDVIPRYQTMLGKHVSRRWGWDCHGLPLENIVEAELGLKTKKDIEDLGIGKFNETARGMVLRYADDWKKIIPRLGRWVDMDDPYRTMDPSYSETIWWIFKTLYDKGLIYEGYKAMHLCPRCETTLSNFEVNQGYKDITDISVYVKFELADESGTYVLAWTTTPWTLPGNVALAVNPEINYVKVLQGGSYYIAARDLAEKAIKDGYEVVAEFSGQDLIGKSYKPVFDYYAKDESLKNRENGWKIYGANFVTTESGTGVVHIAPAFGDDDMKLGQKENLPFIQHVGTNGQFKREVIDFSGLQVKPKDHHQDTDIEIIKNLAHRGLLFAKEKIIHSYPHCWRCDTPLLNYASSSWFVEVTKFRDDLVTANKKVTWVPEHIKEGRFGNWLEGARDWAISRSRFWGAPLPVWKCVECKEVRVIGSIADLISNQKPRNKFIAMRHGQAESNVLGVVSGLPENPHHLTNQGKSEAKASAVKLKEQEIDLIFVSPLLRTKETAEIVATELGLSADKVVVDDRLREVQTGEFNLKPVEGYRNYFNSNLEKMTKRPPGGENLLEMKNRLMDFLVEVDKKYQDKNILIVTHEYAVWMLSAGARGLSEKETAVVKDENEDFTHTGDFKEVVYVPLPHNQNYELDLHRPYIDEVKFTCSCGEEMKRVPDVFDCWFESGAMPYGQQHYLGEAKTYFDPTKNIGFPANFIAEGLDQTRGWFYSLLVLGVALFNKSPYGSVIVNGLVLAEDGSKMSKSKKNYPDPLTVVDKYGADAIRYYMINSPIVRGEDFAFSEKGVDEVYKKVILRLQNVVALYQMYADENVEAKSDSKNVLDQWMIARLNEVVGEVTKGLDNYELDKATRPFDLLVDDLSTWYVRRSRERFKGEDEVDKQAALATTKYVLLELSKLLAPVMPFLAERIYRDLGGEKESVHLETWPQVEKVNEDVIVEMQLVREVVTLGLEARAKAKIKVRQPLNSLIIKSNIIPEFRYLIEEEVNVKKVSVGENPVEAATLDINITPELEEEGKMRDLLREVQDLRKTYNLNPSDRVKLFASQAHYDLAQKFASEFLRVAGVVEIALDASADVRVEKV